MTKGEGEPGIPLAAHVSERELGISGINVTDSRSLLRLCRPLEMRLGCNLHATLPRRSEVRSPFVPRIAYREGI